MAKLANSPRGMLRKLLRAPIPLYRAGLGRLLGRRFVYLAHQGRKSGLRRETVLEVVDFDRAAGELFVVAGWGARSDWFRNIQANPALEIRIAGQTWHRPAHRVLESGEVDALLRAYRGKHPHAWRRLAPLLGFPADPDDPEWSRAVGATPAVAFRRAAAA